MMDTVALQAALDAFKVAEQTDHKAFLNANPALVADMKQAVAYDAALRRQAFFNGLPVPAHRRA